MKKLIFFAALVCCTVMSINAQLKVFNNGNVRIGSDYWDEHGFNLPGMMDTTTMLRVWGPTYSGSNARMSFGYQRLCTHKTVMIGERYCNDDDIDSDILWLQGNKGFCVTYNQLAGDTIIKFEPLENDLIEVYKPIQSPHFLVTSDERLKEDVEPLEQSLDALSALSSVSYRYKPGKTPDYAIDPETERLLEQDGHKSDNEFFAKYYAKEAHGERHYGFIAQEVQKIFPELVHTDKDGYLSVDYIGVIPLLVNAVQELRGRLEKVEGGEDATPTVNRAPRTSGTDELLADRTTEVLSQNTPNPFSSDTSIGYHLPDGTQQAAIYIYDLQGKQVKRLDVDASATSVTLQGGDLQAGMYIYSLIADGRELASKKMILTK
ncbi:MAG: tail fiber domain-containing protein [Muribaculaceae bacterium]|nr:tail fiber domain-containing protein [Muribaculaceae bacterium]